jgi:transposase
LRLQSFLDLRAQRAQLEHWADDLLGDHPYRLLQTIPGIGPVFALTILAEAGDLRRFAHHRQFLKFCGFDLAKNHSGTIRGARAALEARQCPLALHVLVAGRVAVRLRESSIRNKYERYTAPDPRSPDRRRKAYTAIAAKTARIAYAVIKTGRPYRSYYEHDIPGGSISFKRGVEARSTTTS